MAKPTDLVQGTLDLLILKTISLEPKHGWAIAKRIQQVSQEALQIQQGSLYPALHRLEQQAWIKAEWRPTETGRMAKFYSLTRTTVCWRAIRHCGGALWNTAPGKRPRLRSGTRIVCLIPPRSAAGRAVWTPLNRLSLFSAKRSPAPLTGCWRVVILPITKLGLCLG